MKRAGKPTTKRPAHLVPERDEDVERPKGMPDWPRYQINTAQDKLEEIEEMAQAMWRVQLRQRSQSWHEAFKAGDKNLSAFDHKRVRWDELDDSIREAWRTRAKFAWFEVGELEDPNLVEDIAREIYKLSPWCRPYARPGLTPGVGIVPWDNLNEHRMGRDLRRHCEVRARAALRVLERHERMGRFVAALKALKTKRKKRAA